MIFLDLKKYLFIVMLLFMLFLATNNVFAGNITEISEGDVLCSDSDVSYSGFADLAIKIDECDDMVILKNNYSYNSDFDSKYSEGIEINKSLTIDGNGFTIDCKNSANVFKVLSDNVVLRNISFINANGGSSKIISWQGANGSVENCNFIGNYMSFELIHWNGANGSVSNSNFANNHAKSFGLILWDGVGGKITDSSFTNNNASVDGIICWRANNGLVDNSSFINNGDYNYSLTQARIVLDYDANCYQVNPYSNPMIRSMYFYNGGAINWKGSNGVISNSFFLNNSAYDGGAVYLKGNNISFINSSFFNNSAVNEGGAVFSSNSTMFENIIFADNAANACDEIYSKNESQISCLNVVIIKDDHAKLIGVDFEKEWNCTDDFLNDSEISSYLRNAFRVYKNPDSKDSSKIIGNKDIAIYFKSSNYYSVKVYGSDGKVAVGKKVKFIVDGVNYYATVDKKGLATLKVDFKPGKHMVYASYGNVEVKNSITVKTTLITKNVVKKVKKSGKFTVKVLNSKGKAFAKKMVKVQFKGKTYNIKTNSKGIAVFSIPKNLKPGIYTIKTSCNGLKNSNKIIVNK